MKNNSIKNSQIKEWFAFNDKEIGMLQYFVIDYVKENNLDNEKSFQLGVLSTQFQFYMRCVKELTYKNETSYSKDIVSFIKSINLFDNICLFVKNKLVESYKEMLKKKQFEYLMNDKYNTSFFKRTNEENIKLINENWKIIYNKIKKYA